MKKTKVIKINSINKVNKKTKKIIYRRIIMKIMNMKSHKKVKRKCTDCIIQKVDKFLPGFVLNVLQGYYLQPDKNAKLTALKSEQLKSKSYENRQIKGKTENN